MEFGQRRARSSNRISRSMFIVRVWILKICVRLSRSGNPNSTLRSNRPGRRSAGSSVSGLYETQFLFSIDKSRLKQSCSRQVNCIQYSQTACPTMMCNTSHFLCIYRCDIKAERPKTCNITCKYKLQERILPVGCHQNFDITTSIKTIKLVDYFKHGSLNLIITS